MDGLCKLFEENTIVVCRKSEIWKHIFSTHNIEINNINDYVITADQIKICHTSWYGFSNQFEPRLLCYQHTDSARPKLFKDNNIYIITITNNISLTEYLLTNINIYCKLYYSEDIEIIDIDNESESLLMKLNNNNDTFQYNNILESILEERILYGPLLTGLHRCSFTMNLNNKTVNVSSVQYKIDACYETINKILIIKCKFINSKLKSFNIKQLYYPFRELYNATNNAKEIICLYIHKMHDIIHIWTYTFNDYMNMNSIKCTHYQSYKLI
jgi:hypothetical protein